MPAKHNAKYDSHVKPYLQEITEWKAQGQTEKQICKRLDIDNKTFVNYKSKYTELAEAVEKGKKELTAGIEKSLYKRALGYDYEESRTTTDKDGNVTKREIHKRHMPADSKALAMALGKLKREEYKYIDLRKLEIEREKVEVLRQKLSNDMDLEQINNGILSIAELLTNPVKPRDKSKFLTPVK